MGVWLNAFSSVRAPRTEYCMGCRRRQPCSFTNQGRNQLVFGPISSDTRRTPSDGWQPQSHGRDGCKHARWLGDGSRCSPSWHLRHHAIRRIYVGTHQSRGWFRARLERWNRRRSPSALRWVQVVIRDDNRSLLAKPYLDPNPRDTDGNPQYPFYYDELPAGDAGGFSNVDRRNLTAGSQALSHIAGGDNLGLRAQLLRELLEDLPQYDVLKLLPGTSASLSDLTNLREQSIAQALQQWEEIQKARLRHLAFQLIDSQLSVVEEEL